MSATCETYRFWDKRVHRRTQSRREEMTVDDEGMKAAIAREIYRACEDLGAEPDLLAIIGSYGDTLGDDDILSMLKTYNATGRALEWQDGDPLQ